MHYIYKPPPSSKYPAFLTCDSLVYTMEVVELKVRLHCKACEKAVRQALHNIKGVTCVETDVILNKITVMGFVDTKIVVKAIRKTGRRAEVWPSSCRQNNSPRLPPGFRCILPRCGFYKI